jgi:hypothetical protein
MMRYSIENRAADETGCMLSGCLRGDRFVTKVNAMYLTIERDEVIIKTDAARVYQACKAS